MMSEPPNVIFTVKELLQRLDERLSAVDQKLDLRLAQIDERVLHIERIQAERQHLIDEHRQMKQHVEKLMAFRARFLPVSLIAAMLAILGLAIDIYIRSF